MKQAVTTLIEDEPLTAEDRRMIAIAELFERRHRTRKPRKSRKQPEFIVQQSQLVKG